ncbi:carbohydrate binding domain-containing protein [uncultured Bacteroides sp.]|uniref:phage head spike fiber domain-containing protein n=1 Tax=uncultured Bacteroides sp. TaxID=162156 RepID=UPI00280C321E|nr:carbohydrate binding domain-containing protein [uncultured Bacteroides sp.]
MRHVATGQITLLDSNDYLSTGLTAPSNPVAGVTLWVDTSVTPNQLKKWNGTAWEIVSDAQAAIDKAKQDAINDAAQKYVTNSTFSSNFTQLSDSINTKVSQIDFNSLSTRVSSAEQKITSDAIISTVSSTITTAKNEAINAAAADATTKANAAKSSAISAAATDATTKANTAESNAKTYANNTFTPLTTYNTKIAQLENSISLKADSTTVNGINTRLSSAEAKITPDAINLTVKSQITTAVNDVQVGGRNLIKNSCDWQNLYNWGSNGSTMSIVAIDGSNCLRLTGQSGAYQTIGKKLKPNTYYTFSAYARSSVDLSGGIDSQLHVQVWRVEDTSNIHQDHGMNADASFVANVWKKAWYTFKTPTSTELCYCRVYFYPLSSGTFDIRYCQLEEGNKATDWTPAPEDVDASIALRPTTEEIKSQFTMDSSGISILGKKIALTGLVTFSSLASDAQNKINTAQSTAESALTNAGTANLSIGTLQNSLRAMAYQDMVSLAKLDSTIVEGGYIKTSLIDANAVITGSLLATKIAATNITTNRLTIGAGARIGDLYIYDGGLNTNQQGLIAMGENYMGLSRSALSLFYNNYGTQGAGWSRYLSTRAVPGSLSVKCVTSNSNFTDPGLQIEVSGNSDNTAINILAGHISGFRLKMRTVTTSQTLSVADGIIISEADSEITLTLPSSPGNGKMYFIRKNGGGRIWISGSYIINDGDWYREQSTRVQLNRGGLGILMFNGTYWTWNNMNG